MAPVAQFLSLSPATHIEAKPAASVPLEGATQPIEIPVNVVEKTRRSSSTTTDDSSVSPRRSIDENAVEDVPVVKQQFLKLGN
jgi:hypothetical protein